MMPSSSNGRRLRIAAGDVLGHFAADHPCHVDLGAFRVDDIEIDLDRVPRLHHIRAAQAERPDLRTQVGRRSAAPDLRHGVDRGQLVAVGQEHAVPGGGRLHLEAPGEGESAQAESPGVEATGGEGVAVHRGLFRAGQLGRRAELGHGDLPGAGRTEFGDDDGLGAPQLPVSLGNGRQPAVGVDAHDVDVRAQVVDGPIPAGRRYPRSRSWWDDAGRDP